MVVKLIVVDVSVDLERWTVVPVHHVILEIGDNMHGCTVARLCIGYIYAVFNRWAFVGVLLQNYTILFAASLVEWWYPLVPEWKGLLLPVYCGVQHIIGGV